MIKEQEIDNIFQEIDQESTESNIIEEIKQKLYSHNKDVYNTWEGHNFYIDHLFEIRQDFRFSSRYYTTALNICAHKGYAKTVERLVKRGAKSNIKDGGGYISLHCAASNGNIKIVELLLEKGANINSVSKLNSTPLHFAVTKGHVDVVQFLLDKGANPLIEDIHNQTPRDIAKNRNVATVLEEAETAKYNKEIERRKKVQAKIIAISGVITVLVIAPIGYIVKLPVQVLVGISVSVALIFACAYIMSKPNTKVDKIKCSTQDQNIKDVQFITL
ncbi:ankyrin repeat domain-containing protein [Candidatus Mesenet endosymbiont of Agriotes lineatus]|uniref:ankyrin repeat domain-containing protein n=1 Tax=Candidatus Mesenet endosymbiont of Agriotes lineatus TaxID=3077948 RepID=UPI0030D3B32B